MIVISTSTPRQRIANTSPPLDAFRGHQDAEAPPHAGSVSKELAAGEGAEGAWESPSLLLLRQGAAQAQPAPVAAAAPPPPPVDPAIGNDPKSASSSDESSSSTKAAAAPAAKAPAAKAAAPANPKAAPTKAQLRCTHETEAGVLSRRYGTMATVGDHTATDSSVCQTLAKFPSREAAMYKLNTGRYNKLMQCVCGAKCLWPKCRCNGEVGSGKFTGQQCQDVYSDATRTDTRDQWCDAVVGCSRSAQINCKWPNCQCKGTVGSGFFEGQSCQAIYNEASRTDTRDAWCDKVAGCSRDLPLSNGAVAAPPSYEGPNRPLSGEWRQGLIAKNKLPSKSEIDAIVSARGGPGRVCR